MTTTRQLVDELERKLAAGQIANLAPAVVEAQGRALPPVTTPLVSDPNHAGIRIEPRPITPVPPAASGTDGNDEAARLLDAANAATSPGTPGAVNPLVSDALAAGKSNPFLEVAKTITPAAVTPVAPQDTAPVPGAPVSAYGTPGFNPNARDWRIPAPNAESPEGNTFLDMLLQNDAYRLQNKEAFERNEKANRARTTIAAVTDALASLGNLVGTTQGAFSQPQTYQTPFVMEQVEADRTRARQLADRIQASDQSIRLAKAREEMTNGTYALRQALEEEKTRRAQMNNEARADLEGQRQEGRLELEKLKQGGRVSLKQMDIDYKQDKDAMQAALRQQGINISRGRLDEMIRHNQSIEVIRENGGSGVGGYKTIITRDEFGREISRERIPTGGSGSGSKSGGFDLGGSGSKAGGFNLG